MCSSAPWLLLSAAHVAASGLSTTTAACKHGPQPSWRHKQSTNAQPELQLCGGRRAASWQPADESTSFKFARVRKKKKKRLYFYSRSCRAEQDKPGNLTRPTVCFQAGARRGDATPSTVLAVFVSFLVAVVLLLPRAHIPSSPRVHVGIPAPDIT